MWQSIHIQQNWKIHYTILSFYQRKDYSGGSIENGLEGGKKETQSKTKRLLKSSEKWQAVITSIKKKGLEKGVDWEIFRKQNQLD